MLGTLPEGARGFDCDAVVSQADARSMRAAQYQFVARYLGRVVRKPTDLSSAEVLNCLLGGIGILPVQHAPHPGWIPAANLGEAYGHEAVVEARDIGLPAGLCLGMDLEEVAYGTPAAQTIGHCNSWCAMVAAAAYQPILYVGDGCGLTNVQLYRDLKFTRYWRAYNTNSDHVPIVRGFQLHQLEYPAPVDRVPGISFQYDENVVKADAFGSSPVFLLP